MKVEVAYATAERQLILALEVPPGTTAGDAIERSGLRAQFPEIDLARQDVGIFGRVVSLSEPLSDGDRVEVYRPLERDPKQARREIARRRLRDRR